MARLSQYQEIASPPVAGIAGEACGGESVSFKERRLVGKSARSLLDDFEGQSVKIVSNSCAILRRTGSGSDWQ